MKLLPIVRDGLVTGQDPRTLANSIASLASISMMLGVLFIVAVIAPLASSQSLNAQLHNASATGNVQQLANLVAKVRAANPRNYLSQLSNCFEGPPSECTGDNPPTWCGAYSAFPSSGGDQDECLSGDSCCPLFRAMWKHCKSFLLMTMPVIEWSEYFTRTTSLSLEFLHLSCPVRVPPTSTSPVLIPIAVLHTAAKARQSGSIKFLTGIAGMDVDVLDRANQVKLYNSSCVLPSRSMDGVVSWLACLEGVS